MIKVTVLDDYQGIVARLDAVNVLEGLDIDLDVMTHHIEDESALARVLAKTDYLVLIRERTQISANLIAALPCLKLIVQTGRLSSCIDLEACRTRGIPVKDGSGNPIAPTELTWALILAASRRLVPYAQQLAQGNWQRSATDIADESLGRAVHGRTLGVWGYGKIGRRVAAIGRAFGMTILVHGREQSSQAAIADGFEFVADRRDFLRRLDILSLHLRLCPKTQHMITQEDLACLRSDALLVNTSRAELLAPGALLAGIRDGHPGSAALDVFADEPGGVNEYLAAPQILCTPHLGFVERDTFESYFREAFTHVRTFVQERNRH